ncbi:hypothetical protein DIPPA_27448 [Diplonema papillatum]|nr:hypothetical protein DIPPA_27448 [Diplonema papillatum]
MRRRPRALSSATPQVPPHATKDASIKQLWAWASKEDPRPWPLTVSAQALDFVASAVQLRPSRRPTAAALRAHCWLTQGSMPPGPVSLAALAPVPVEKDAVVICPIMWKPLPPGMDDILGDPFDRDADEPLNNNDCVDDEEDGLSSE